MSNLLAAISDGGRLLTARVASLSSPKKARLCPKTKPDSSFKAYTHKTWITKHKMDVKTRQKQ